MTVCQVSHEPVTGKLTDVAAPPFTLMSIGRAAALPLANRIVSVAPPAAAALTDHWTNPPATLV